MRMVLLNCKATISPSRNIDHELIKMAKLVVKDIWVFVNSSWICYEPNDHPHGGGEGKCGIGRSGPSTP